MQITYEIIQRCVEDDRKAIELLYEHCFHGLMPVCMRYHKNEEDARSSFNLGFIKILKSLPGTDEKLNFGGWAKRIMVNTLIDEYRKTKKYNERVSSRETERELDFHGESHDNDAISNMGYENILALLNELPEITAKVFNLYVIEGYSHKEIGELLDISEGTSKWHLSTGRKQLRDLLEKLEGRSKRMVI